MLDIKYPEKTISSFEQFIEEIENYSSIRRIEPRLYRGQANKKWQITSSLYRKLFNATDDTVRLESDPKRISDAIEIHINEGRLRQASYPEITNMGDFQLLAEIQHMGGLSPFIDYTSNPLIALFFACATHQNSDGCISCINPYSINSIQEFKANSAHSWNDILKQNRTNFFWQLARSNHRILKQSGYFIFNADGFISKFDIEQFFIIDSRAKTNICRQLDIVCNISWDTVYPDFLGYIQNNT